MMLVIGINPRDQRSGIDQDHDGLRRALEVRFRRAMRTTRRRISSSSRNVMGDATDTAYH